VIYSLRAFKAMPYSQEYIDKLFALRKQAVELQQDIMKLKKWVNS
jgi:hypothetical protein